MVAGGGVALLDAIPAVNAVLDTLEGDEKTGASIILKALRAPIYQIAANAGIEGAVIVDKILSSTEKNYGYDAYREVFGDMFAFGIIDPAKVTRSASAERGFRGVHGADDGIARCRY